MTTPEFFDRFEREVARSRRKLFETRLARTMMDGSVPLEAYKGYLRETYHFTKHTPRFLAAAAARFGDDLDAVRRRFLKHTLEEFGHDRFALNDLAALGVDPEEVKRSEPLVATTAMVAFHYHMAEHGNPVGMFGMIYVLEGLAQAKGGEAAKRIREGLGLPAEAMTFLSEHAVLDVAHLREAKRAILEHVHGEAHERAVIYAGRAAFELYSFMFEQIWERYESESGAPKPESVAALA